METCEKRLRILLALDPLLEIHMARTVLGIVEDHLMFLEVVRKVCMEDPEHVVAVEARLMETAIEAIEKRRPSIVILDLALPDGDGFQVMERVSATSPGTRFILISCHCDQFTAARIRASPAVAFIDKNTSSISALREAIKVVKQGATYFSETFVELAATELASQRSIFKLLSARETEVLSLIASGSDDSEIGYKLDMSPLTAKTHRSRILRKLNFKNTTKLVAFAIKNGFCLAGGSDTLPRGTSRREKVADGCADPISNTVGSV